MLAGRSECLSAWCFISRWYKYAERRYHVTRMLPSRSQTLKTLGSVKLQRDTWSSYVLTYNTFLESGRLVQLWLEFKRHQPGIGHQRNCPPRLRINVRLRVWLEFGQVIQRYSIAFEDPLNSGLARFELSFGLLCSTGDQMRTLSMTGIRPNVVGPPFRIEAVVHV